MTDQKNIFTLTFWYAFGNILTRAISFLLLPFYSNLLTPEQFGSYSLILAFYSIIAIIYQFGVPSALTKYYIEAKNFDQSEVFSSAFNFVVLCSLVLSLFGFVLSDSVSILVLGDSNYNLVFNVVFIILFIETMSYLLLHLQKMNEKPKIVAFVSISSAIVNLILNIVLVYYMDYGIIGIFYAQLGASVVLFISLAPAARRSYKFKLNFELLNPLLKFALPLVIGGLLSVLIDFVDRFILDSYLDRESVGHYSFGYRIAMVMNVFVISFRTAWGPRALKMIQQSAYKYEFGRIFTKLIAVSAMIFLSVSLLVDNLFEISFNGFSLFDKSYLVGLDIIPLILVAYLFNLFVSFYSVYPYKSGRSYHFLISDTIGFTINILLNLIFIPLYGLVGAAVATLISFFFNALYLFLISRGKVEVNYELAKVFMLVLFAGAFYLISVLFNNVVYDLFLILIYLIILYKVFNINIIRIFSQRSY
ncbi:MAG: oligosaccharide flippase family protein [Melioribacteraceae bacterium]|nr:oligosaccharide flippase family protein [Melioribacteraceae bacterium]